MIIFNINKYIYTPFEVTTLETLFEAILNYLITNLLLSEMKFEVKMLTMMNS